MNLIIKNLIKNLLGKFQKTLYLLLAFSILCSHDLYIKMETYFLQPNVEATLSLYNGTFDISENLITRDRLLDASIIANGKREAIKAEQWEDQDSTITKLRFNTGEPGTYVVGVSTKARNIELTAEKFNSYLKNDGVLDQLEYRSENNLLDQDAVERYEKHVKAIYQVGDLRTDDWNTVFGYPIEFIPQTNPYNTYSGETLEVKLLLDGKPLANQLVFSNHVKIGHHHSHEDQSHKREHDEGSHTHQNGQHENGHSHDNDNTGNQYSHTHGHDNDKHDHEHEHSKNKLSHTHSHENENHSHTHNVVKSQHNHDNEKDSDHGHSHTNAQQLRTNEQGIVSVDLPEDGIYYLRTIHMVKLTDNDEITHESKWATLTFEVSHKHGPDTHTHEEHENDGEIPSWIFILGSILIVGVLFLIFRKKE